MNVRAVIAATAGAAAVLLGLPAPASAEPGPGGVVSAYTLVAPRSTAASGLVVRAVVAAGVDCPTVTATLAAGSRTVRMAERSAPTTTAPAFDAITVCSAPLPVGTRSASVGGLAVPAVYPSNVDRLALVGDTGCRVVPWEVQDCSDPSAWPLAPIAQSIARERPDAVLFAGDFFYREGACPRDLQSLCGSSPPPVEGLPFTDSAYGWIADVLVPMAPMLAAAPFIATRGNHEACYRGGNGYFLLFDPRDGTEGTCAPVPGPKGLEAAPTNPTPTYAIDLGLVTGRTLRLAIVDSAGGTDTSVTPFAAVQRPAYERAARLTERAQEAWLVTHRPLFAFVSDTFASPGQPFSPWTSLDQTAAAQGLLDGYDLILSSHIHLAQAVRLPGLPPQLVLGNGGTLLDPAVGYPLPQTAPLPGYPAPTWAWVAPRFGYALGLPGAEPGEWRLRMRDPAGRTFADCGLRAASLYCRDA
jgi:hypothetical protein